MKTIAKVLTSIACVALISVSAWANKPHLPRHKAHKNTHSKIEHKHTFSKAERQMRRMQCKSVYTTPGYESF